MSIACIRCPNRSSRLLLSLSLQKPQGQSRKDQACPATSSSPPHERRSHAKARRREGGRREERRGSLIGRRQALLLRVLRVFAGERPPQIGGRLPRREPQNATISTYSGEPARR